MTKKKQLTKEQKLKIINNDIALWLKNFVKIIDNNNELVPFNVNAVQKDFLKNKDKFNLILKSRQLGFSTLSLGIMLYYAYQIPNSTYLMIAHDSRSLRELFVRLKTMQDNIPQEYKLEENKNNRDELELENNSRIIIQCPTSGMGAGMTLQMIHLSEMALYAPDKQEIGLSTIEQSLAKNKDSMIIIESTARGVQNYHYKLWQDAQKERSRYKAFFYGWTSRTHANLFRYEVDLAVEWWKKTYGKGTPLRNDPLALTTYEQMLIEKTKVSLKQLMWRQWKLQSMKESDFKQEYPAFAEEAFIISNVGVFDAEIVMERMNYIPSPLKNVENLPLTLQRYIGSGLNIYQLPVKDMWYYGGVDTSLGTGKGDYSSLCILDSDGEQVATFNRNDIPTYKFVDIVAELGYFFNYCIWMVERNSYGIDILQRLWKEKQYVNLSKTKRKDAITGRTKWSHGWHTDRISKTVLVNDAKEAVEMGLVLLNDLETLEQLKIYQEKAGSFGNIRGEGNYDDLADALFLAIQAMKMGRYYI